MLKYEHQRTYEQDGYDFPAGGDVKRQKGAEWKMI